MNLIYGSSWQIRDSTGTYQSVSPASLDSNGWVKSLPAGSQVIRDLAVPLIGGTFVCNFQGTGTLGISGPGVSNVSETSEQTHFTLASTFPTSHPATLSYSVDATDYIRNIDCREANASRTDTLTPQFIAALSKFKIIRVMKWQPATEGNWAVSWGSRNKPGDGDYGANDGVPVEVLVEAANRAGSDLWVTIPWNADNDYITRFATYVRDNLAAGRHVYVEVSNEVWNGGYPVAAQAAKEAIAENLPSASGSGQAGNLERYAEKTEQVMAIWSGVFAGQTGRLVRVASFQHGGTYFSDLLLKYLDLSQSVDALATSPYFGYEVTDAMTLDQIMAALPADVSTIVGYGIQQKAIAQKYGLRYITYEAGQSIVLPNNVSLEQQVQRDPRMYEAYQQFLSSWQTQIGDSLTLFALEGPSTKWGAWGLSDYIGQPLALAPKLRAVYEFLGISSATLGPPIVYSPTQVCPNGTIVAQTSACP